METPIKKASKRVDRSLLNDDISAANVRLVGADGSKRGIVSRAEALAEARAAGLDLVLVAVDANPPVCKVMDYGKHLFELKKTKAAQRKKQKQIQVKEMKFRPGTEEGDYQVKLRNLKRFLEEGDKTKVSGCVVLPDSRLLPCQDGRRRLSGKTTQPEAFSRRRGQDKGVFAVPRS